MGRVVPFWLVRVPTVEHRAAAWFLFGLCLGANVRAGSCQAGAGRRWTILGVLCLRVVRLRLAVAPRLAQGLSLAVG